MPINWIQYPDSLLFNTDDKIIVSEPSGNTKNLSFPFTSNSSGITFTSDIYFTNLTEAEQEFTIQVAADGKLTKSTAPSERSRIQVRNDEGSVIPAGAPLYSRGEIGGSNRIKVGICVSSDPAKMPCIGIAEFEMNTSNTKDSFAITQGVYNTNISGFTGLSEGDILYVNGGVAPHLTPTKPTNGSLIQNVGIVLKAGGGGTICQGLLVAAIGRTNDVPWPLYVDHTNQRVGIGTDSPAQLLHVDNPTGASSILLEGASGYNSQILFRTDPSSAGGWLNYDYSANVMTLGTNASERMRLTSGGDLLIGTTSGSSKLVVAGRVDFQSDLRLRGTDSLLNQGVVRFFVDSNNKLFIDTANDGSNLFAIDSSGQVTVPATPVASTDAASKGYVDAQVGSVDTLEEVTANGNSTSYGIEFTSANFSIGQSKIGLFSNNVIYLRGGSGGLVLSNGDGQQNVGFIGNYIRWETGSSEKMRLTSDGRLGIGTTSPSAKLNINTGLWGTALKINSTTNTAYNWNLNQISPGTFVINEGYNNTDMLAITSGGNVGIGTSSPQELVHLFKQSHSNPLLIEVENDGYLAGTSAGIKLTSKATDGVSGSWTIDNLNRDTLRFLDDGSEKMRLTSTGRLGIGTTSPQKLLEVKSSSAYDSTLRLQTTLHNWDIQGGESGYSSTAFAIDYDGVTFFRALGTNDSRFGSGLSVGNIHTTSPTSGLYVAGNVGIGTSSPNRKIHVVSSEYVIGDFVRSSGTNAYLSFQDSTTSGSGFVGVGAAGNSLLFRAGNVEHMRLTSNLLIGTTTDNGDKLQIGVANSAPSFATDPNVAATIASTTNGDEVALQLYVNDGTNNIRSKYFVDDTELLAGFDVTYSTGLNGFAFKMIGSEKMRLSSGGNLLIGTTTDNTTGDKKLQVDGDIFLSNTTNKIVFNNDSNYHERNSIVTTATNLGLYNNYSSGYITLNTDGSERMRLTSGGNLLIGTTSDSGNYKLKVSGEIFSSGSTITAYASNTSKSILTNIAGGGALNLISSSGTSVSIRGNGVSYFNGGNVLIGTTSDSGQKLQVNGSITGTSAEFSSDIDIKNNGNANLSLSKTDNDQKLELIGGNGGVQMIKSSYELAFYRGGAEKMRLTTNGLLIGTTSGTKLLNLNKDDSTGIIADIIGGSSYGATINFSRGGGYNWQTGIGGNATGNDIPFSNFGIVEGTTTRLVIGVGGNVGINTLSPSEKLHVVGNVKIEAANPYITLTDTTNPNYCEIKNIDGNLDLQADKGNQFGNSRIRFYLDSAEKMTLSNTGLGIGTATPSRKLEATSTSSYVAVLNSSQNNSFLSFNDANTSGDTYVAIGSENGDLISRAGNTERMRLTTDGDLALGLTSASKRLHVYDTTSGIARLETNQTYSDVELKTNNGTAYVSARDGHVLLNRTGGNNVGIGTDSPSQKLTVEGNIELGTGGYIYGDTTTPYLRLNNAAGTVLGYSNGYISLGPSFVYNNASGEQFRISHSNGYVGIGTTSPGYKLHVNGNATIGGGGTSGTDAIININSGSGSGGESYLNLKRNNVSGFILNHTATAIQIRALANIDMLFHTNNLERARITSGGNLLIGTTTDAGVKLNVNGTILCNNELQFTNSAMRIYRSSDNMKFRTNNTDKLTITSGGNVLIGTTTDDGSSKLQVNGNIKVGDNDELIFGDSNDFKIYHYNSEQWLDNSTGDWNFRQIGVGNMIFQNLSDNKDIIFQSDNGTGGITTYLELDGSQTTVNFYKTVLIGTTTNTGAYKIDVAGKQRVQDTLELDDVLMLNAISTPSDPAAGKSVIYMDSADGGIKCKINVGGTVVTRTLASFE